MGARRIVLTKSGLRGWVEGGKKVEVLRMTGMQMVGWGWGPGGGTETVEYGCGSCRWMGELDWCLSGWDSRLGGGLKIVLR